MNDTTDIPVTRAELYAEAIRIIERDGMPDETTALAELVLGYLNDNPAVPAGPGTTGSLAAGPCDDLTACGHPLCAHCNPAGPGTTGRAAQRGLWQRLWAAYIGWQNRRATIQAAAARVHAQRLPQ